MPVLPSQASVIAQKTKMFLWCAGLTRARLGGHCDSELESLGRFFRTEKGSCLARVSSVFIHMLVSKSMS